MGEYSTWKEFAEDAGVSAPQISDFQNAAVEPSGLNLFKLIEAASRRAGASEEQIAAQALPPDRLAKISEGVAALLEGQHRLLAAAGIGEQQSPSRVAPKRTKRA